MYEITARVHKNIVIVLSSCAHIYIYIYIHGMTALLEAARSIFEIASRELR